MSKARVERSPLSPKILFGFTDHPITVWAGVILLRVYFQWIKLREELSLGLTSFTTRSNNRISAVDVMLGVVLWISVRSLALWGFYALSMRPIFGGVVGDGKVASPDTIRRLFLQFDYRRVTDVSERLMRFSLSRMHPIMLGHTVDLDSTVFCRYGQQQGCLRGYNPYKPGRRSHHPWWRFENWGNIRVRNIRVKLA